MTSGTTIGAKIYAMRSNPCRYPIVERGGTRSKVPLDGLEPLKRCINCKHAERCHCGGWFCEHPQMKCLFHAYPVLSHQDLNSRI
jgi:hypothetical protein